MPVTLNFPAGSVTVKLSEIEFEESMNKKVIPIPDEEPYIIPMGSDGTNIIIKFKVKSTGDANSFMSLRRGDKITISYGEGYTYVELPSGSVWYCDKRNSKRMKGYVNTWECTLHMLKEGQEDE